MATVMEATMKDGQIVPDGPLPWPNGVRLRVEPIDELIGMTEDEQGDDPESIARWIAEWRALSPLTMTPEDEAAWREWDRKTQEYNLEVASRQMVNQALAMLPAGSPIAGVLG